jgi:chromosome segregation protein
LTSERATLDTLEARLKDYRSQGEPPASAVRRAPTRTRPTAVFEARELQRAAERRHQEAGFALTTCTNKIRELSETLARIDQEIAGDESRLTQARDELGRLPADALDVELQLALTARTEAETALAAARDALEGLTAQPKHDERAGVAAGLDPLRRIGS